MQTSQSNLSNKEPVMGEEKRMFAGADEVNVARRTFLRGATQTAFGLAAAQFSRADAQAVPTPPATRSPVLKIPAHLPPRLTITQFLWTWLTACSPGEVYYDLERVFAECVERHHNCIRADVALNWAFDQQGRPRGPIEVGPWAAGVSDNLRGLFGKAGVRYDALERVLRLFELARKYNIYIIATSWEYQDSTTHLVDPKLREDVFSTPPAERFERLANMHDRLIQELKKHGLEKQIAFVELHNEINGSQFPLEWNIQTPLVEKALHRLQQAHPDILFTGDYVNIGPVFQADFPGYQALPTNMQVADHHIYTLGVQKALHDLTNTWIGNQVPPDPKDNELLRWLIGDTPRVSWAEFTQRAALVNRHWWALQWFFANLTDPDRYDYWEFEHFGEYSAMMTALIEGGMRDWSLFARHRGIPAVIDEGYIFYPPRNSRFEESAAGRTIDEVVVNTGIALGYWGIMLSNYAGPHEPLWTENPAWIKRMNQKILASPAVPQIASAVEHPRF
jgi:hypothetical protein